MKDDIFHINFADSSYATGMDRDVGVRRPNPRTVGSRLHPRVCYCKRCSEVSAYNAEISWGSLMSSEELWASMPSRAALSSHDFYKWRISKPEVRDDACRICKEQGFWKACEYIDRNLRACASSPFNNTTRQSGSD
jgi:hypothetical protein